MNDHIVVIGCTSSPECEDSLVDLVRQLEINYPLVVMHSGNPKDLIERLRRVSKSVYFVEEDTKLDQGVYVHQGRSNGVYRHLKFIGKRIQYKLSRKGHNLFDKGFFSASKKYKSRLIAVMLGGIGFDGCEGLRSVKIKEGYTCVLRHSTEGEYRCLDTTIYLEDTCSNMHCFYDIKEMASIINERTKS